MVKKISKEQVEEFELLESQLGHAYQEMKDLSKKTPKDNLNVLKINVINRMLERIKSLLVNEPTNDFLDLLKDDVTLPNVSDAVLIISQYIAAMEQFKQKYTTYTGDWMC